MKLEKTCKQILWWCGTTIPQTYVRILGHKTIYNGQNKSDIIICQNFFIKKSVVEILCR